MISLWPFIGVPFSWLVARKNARPVKNCRCIVARAVQRWQVGARGRGKAVERDPHLLTTTGDIQSGPAR